MKRLLSICLIVMMLFSVPAYANGTNMEVETTYSETLTLDGIENTFDYYDDANGNKIIKITNEQTGAIDYVKSITDDNKIIIYLNDTEFAILEKNNIISNREILDAGWTYIGSVSHNWTQRDAVTTAMVAGGIAAALSGIIGIYGFGNVVTVSAVITAMGEPALQAYLNKYIDAVIYAAMYQQTSWGQTTLRVDYSIYFEGRLSPDYSAYIPVNYITSEECHK